MKPFITSADIQTTPGDGSIPLPFFLAGRPFDPKSPGFVVVRLANDEALEALLPAVHADLVRRLERSRLAGARATAVSYSPINISPLGDERWKVLLAPQRVEEQAR